VLKAYLIRNPNGMTRDAHVGVDVVCQSDFQLIKYIFFKRGKIMLRVISGKYKSRKIVEVKSFTTRPTTDKNKEILFNTIGQYFEGGRALDLFAGSGSLGIEAYSRGIDKVDFVEKNIQAYKVIKTNLLNLEINDCKVHRTDALEFLKKADCKYLLILVDPPYKLDIYAEILEIISSRQLLEVNGIIVMESVIDKIMPEEKCDIYKYKEKLMGYSKFSFYKKRRQL
jgi:16S rRNA (guanine(966)-N(2))-methyltransferase RsmD